jgi:hypothetical protein
MIVLFSVCGKGYMNSRTYGEFLGDGVDNKFMFELEWYVFNSFPRVERNFQLVGRRPTRKERKR